jgi:hypothetical protein
VGLMTSEVVEEASRSRKESICIAVAAATSGPNDMCVSDPRFGSNAGAPAANRRLDSLDHSPGGSSYERLVVATARGGCPQIATASSAPAYPQEFSTRRFHQQVVGSP